MARQIRSACILCVLVAMALVVPIQSASSRTSVRDVSAAAARCGMRGVKVSRDLPFRRSFLIGDGKPGESWTAPLTPEQERKIREGERIWNCLQAWARRHHVSINPTLPPVITY